MSPKGNVQRVVEDDLCTGCGTCVSVCPQNAVHMKETPAGLLVPSINSSCNLCGICASVCPGDHLEAEVLKDDVDPFKGKVLAAFLAQATDRDLLFGCQSGGAVTVLLCHLLESHQIDGAIVTEMPENKSLRPRVFYATSRDELVRAQGSKYCPVAVNAVLTGNKSGEMSRTAFVGLGCHVHGLRNAQACGLSNVQNVSLVIGLACGGTFSFGAIDYLVGLSGIRREQAMSFYFRSKRWTGWPGDVCIWSSDGVAHRVENKQRMLARKAFSIPRCLICFDQMNVFSDLVVGDPWGIRDDKRGYSVVLARTQRGLDALLSAKEAGGLMIEIISPDSVFKGQTVERKRREWSVFTDLWRRMGKPLPQVDINERWMKQNISKVELREYRRRLEWSLKLAHCRTEEDAVKMTVRRMSFLRLIWVISPKRVFRLLRRRVQFRHRLTVAFNWLRKLL